MSTIAKPAFRYPVVAIPFALAVTIGMDQGIATWDAFGKFALGFGLFALGALGDIGAELEDVGDD